MQRQIAQLVMAPTIGSFPYAPGFNPYQRLFTSAIESAGLAVNRIPPTKWFPLHHAIKQNCDLLHLDWPHDWYRGKNTVTRLLKRQMYFSGLRALRRKPIVWTAHNLVAHNASNADDERRMVQHLINRCSGIMVMSHVAKELLTSHFDIPQTTSVRVVHHGHYMDCYPNEVTREKARDELSIGEDEFVYLSLGSIQPYKGLIELVQAFASVSEKHDCLVIAGASKHEGYLEQLNREVASAREVATGRILLIPQEVGSERLQVFFNAADICVLPFTDIVNSGSLLLAMSFGKPVVAPRLGSIPEIAHAPSYIGYDPEARDALTTSLRVAKQNAASFDQQALMQFVRDRYGWGSIGGELREWYLELLAGKC